MAHILHTLSDLMTNLQKDWPSLSCPSSNVSRFWSHEWEKHGTCSESQIDQHDYFEAALNQKKKVNLQQILRIARIEPDDGFYSLDNIVRAIIKGIGHTSRIECNKDSHDFGINGLWPNYRDGSYPSNCDPNNSFNQDKISDLISNMQKIWPSLTCSSSISIQFWTHEWEKHGTCSESVLNQHGYFDTALSLKGKKNLLKALKSAGKFNFQYFSALFF
ncbi:ribonuclease 1 [Quercus suber]|uniref:Ribonuclease 1 n=1 Tax=Quercus suber TaxID=58331 RepID=A0AAW0IZL8_QUESU